MSETDSLEAAIIRACREHNLESVTVLFNGIGNKWFAQVYHATVFANGRGSADSPLLALYAAIIEMNNNLKVKP